VGLNQGLDAERHKASDSDSQRESHTEPWRELAEPSEMVEPNLSTDECFHDAPLEFGSADLSEIGWEGDPLGSEEESKQSTSWEPSFFWKFDPRSPSVPHDEVLRRQMKVLLTEIEAGPPGSDIGDMTEGLLVWLRSVKNRVHPVENFVAGFGRHIAAWKELLADSNRPA
jgi:hypothetical protein